MTNYQTLYVKKCKEVSKLKKENKYLNHTRSKIIMHIQEHGMSWNKRKLMYVTSSMNSKEVKEILKIMGIIS